MPAPESDANKPLVLVVGGRAETLPALRAALTERGFRTELAEDGGVAVGVFQRLAPDVVLVDLPVEGMDGPEVTHSLLRMDSARGTAVVVLVDEDDEDTIERAYRTGAADVVARLAAPAFVAQRVRFVLRSAVAIATSGLASGERAGGLADRRQFLDQLTYAISQTRLDGTSLAVLCLELDRFRELVYGLPRESVDELLECVAQRLASIGISSFPDQDVSPEELLGFAQTAAYCAKQEGQDTVQFYQPTMNSRAFERLSLESSLRHALERDEFLVYYQPRVEISSGKLLSFEALVRWQHPELGLVAPGQFIPLAEETGLIVPIGEWVLATACAQNRAWQAEGLGPVRVSVNLSSAQFQHPDLFDMVLRTLGETGLDPEWLELELTESLLMQNAEAVVGTLKRFRDTGIHLSIDDFGTGYSSLSYLKRFPIDALKIDQSFIREVTTNADDAALATSIILMGRSLKLRVVAEGVETESQLSFLRIMQCDEAQGFLYSPPVPAAEAVRFLREGVTKASAA